MPTLSDLNPISTLVSRGLVLTGPQNAPLSNGRQVAIWETTSNNLRFQIVDVDGKPAGLPQTVAKSGGKVGQADVAVLSDGGFIISYVYLTGGITEIRATRYSDTGQQIGSEMRLFAEPGQNMYSPRVETLEDGGFAVVVRGYHRDEREHATFLKTFDLDGTARNNSVQMEETRAGIQKFPEVQSLENGNLIAVWASQSVDGSGDAVVSRVFNAQGVPQGRETRLNQFTRGDQEDLAITRLADGSLIAVWMSEGQSGTKTGIVARHLTAEGVPQGNEFLVNETRVVDQTLASVAALDDGGFIIAWTNTDENPDAMAREYKADLTPATGEIQLSQSREAAFLGPEVVTLSNGEIGAVWLTIRVSGGTPIVGVEIRTTISDNPIPTDGDDILTYNDQSSGILALSGNDWITPGAGSDTIDGGAGVDMVSFIDQSQAVRVDLSTGRATSGSDLKQLSNVENITGSAFKDYIVGDDGNNRLRGAGDYDWFIGSEGADFYDGGDGRDMVSYISSRSGVEVNLDRGLGSAGLADGDRYYSIERVTGSSYQDHLTGDSGDNDFRGLGDYDWFDGSAGRDRYDGGSGLDMISYSASSSAVAVYLSRGRGTQGDAARDSYVSVERVTGSSYDDILHGDDGRNVLRGLYGEDTLKGNGGADRLIGGGSDDYLDGGAGWDYAIFDGNRDDYRVSTRGSQTRVERIADGNEGTDTLVNIEVIQFQDDFVYL